MAGLPLDHIAIVSQDIRADIDFYSGLGFTVEARYEDWAMMRDERGRGLALLAPGGKHPPHCALRATTREAVEKIAREHGIEAAVRRDRSVSVYLKDPSGNSIELIYYPPTEDQEL
jgi:catechol 2,3-dioxygenase-like lactoylglutathione lyase family enzyme